MKIFISILSLLFAAACSKEATFEMDTKQLISKADLVILCEQREEEGLNRYHPIETIKGNGIEKLLNKNKRLRSYTHRDLDVQYHDLVLVLFKKDEKEMEGFRRLGIIPVENDSIEAFPTDSTREERIELEIIRQNKASHTMSANARLFHNDPMEIDLNRLGTTTEAAIVWI